MIGKPLELIQYLFEQDKNKVYEIREHKEKRSLNANAYAWALMNEIGNKLSTSKEEIYLEMLKSYGQCATVSILANVDISNFFKYYEQIGEGNVNGKNFIHYKIYKGSSEYNSLEMSKLIEGIVYEAKQLGVPTLDELELNRICEEWGV